MENAPKPEDSLDTVSKKQTRCPRVGQTASLIEGASSLLTNQYNYGLEGRSICQIVKKNPANHPSARYGVLRGSVPAFLISFNLGASSKFL